MRLLSFESAGQGWALPAREVLEVMLRPALLAPPDLPGWLEGFFNLSGRSVAVVRADRLLGGSEDSRSLYTHLILLKAAGYPVALAVERVLGLIQVAPEELLAPAPPGSGSRAVAALIQRDGELLSLLSTRRLLLEEEQAAVSRLAEALP